MPSLSRVRDDSDGKDGTDHRQEREGVPVSERLGQPILVERIVERVEPVREQSRGESVARNHRDPDECADEDA